MAKKEKSASDRLMASLSQPSSILTATVKPASFPRDHQNEKSARSLPPLTKEAKARLKRLSELPDEEIDCSDIPEWTEEDFKNALYVPAMTKDGDRDWNARVKEAMRKKKEKRAISLRIDANVYDWLKAQGPRYQSRINAILKAYMEAHR